MHNIGSSNTVIDDGWGEMRNIDSAKYISRYTVVRRPRKPRCCSRRVGGTIPYYRGYGTGCPVCGHDDAWRPEWTARTRCALRDDGIRRAARAESVCQVLYALIIIRFIGIPAFSPVFFRLNPDGTGGANNTRTRQKRVK